LRIDTKNLSSVFVIGIAVGIGLLLVPYDAPLVEPYVIAQTTMRSTTFMSTMVLAATRVEVRRVTTVSTVQDHPPQVIITNHEWNPPRLTLYLKNNGGSGWITLQFTFPRTQMADQHHMKAGATDTYIRDFPAIGRSSEPPDVRIVDQRADSGVKTETVTVEYPVGTYIDHTTLVTAYITHRTETTIVSTSVVRRKQVAIWEMLLGSGAGASYVSIILILMSIVTGTYGVVSLVMKQKIGGPVKDACARPAVEGEFKPEAIGETSEMDAGGKAEYREYLKRLEELRNKGKISGKTYERLRKRYLEEIG
jgi:hypothetical protein